MTPQVVVTDGHGRIRYRGRIDNRYEAFGRARRVVTERNLRDAVDAVLGGRAVATPETPGHRLLRRVPDLREEAPMTMILGILLAALTAASVAWPRDAPPSAPTFSETIAPIVFDNCVSCHRSGEAAPFTLTSYEDVARRAELIVEVTGSRYMPPWKAAPGHGEFKDERRLTDAQIAAIRDWFEGGMPRGDLTRMPPLPVFRDGWQLGTPDLILEMPAPFTVPATGPDIYRNFAPRRWSYNSTC